MIIGKNTNLQNQNNFVKENNTSNTFHGKNPVLETNRTMQHANVMNKNEMTDKAFSMLQDRLNKGLISMDEFSKACVKLGKTK